MCKYHILTIGIYLHAFYIWADQTPADSSYRSGNSPEEREFLESVREKLKKQEIYWRSKDFSKYNTEELFDFIPPGSTSISSILASDELKKRPNEVRVMIEKKLNLSGHTFDTLYQLPFLAGIVGTEYQVEVAKRCLFHEAMKQADMSLRIQEDVEGYGIFSLIAQSKHDETAVIDRLIAEDRLERGSEFEIKWRKRFSDGNRKQKNLDEKSGLSDMQIQDRKTLESVEINSNKDLPLKGIYFFLAIVMVLVGILALLLKVWKHKSAGCS